MGDFETRFKHGALPDNIAEQTISIQDKDISLVQLLKLTGLTTSTSESLRMIDQGAVKLNEQKVTDKSLKLAQGETVVLQVGKRKFARVVIQ